MVYETINTYAVESGPEIFMCYVNDVTGGFFMGFLYMAIFLIMAIGSFYITKKATGSGDFPAGLTLGSWTTLIFSILMRLVTCPKLPLTSDLALGVTIALSFLSVLFLYFSKD